MKLNTSITALLSLLCIQTSVLAEENAKKEIKVKPKVIVKSIQVNDKEAVGAAIAKAIGEIEKENGDPAKDFNLEGIIELGLNGDGEIPDFNVKGMDPKVKKNIIEELKNAKKTKATLLIGNNGEVHKLKEGEDLSDAINQLIKNASPKNGKMMKIGPAFIAGLGDTAGLKKEILEMKKEQAEQRKLLEAILQKLK